MKNYPANVYLRSILLTATIVLGIFAVQINFVADFSFQPRMIFGPLSVSIVTGLMLGKIRLLRDQLADKSKLFRALADFSLEFAFFRKVSGEYEYASPACQRLTGYTPEDFYATPSFMDRLIHPDDMHIWKNHVHNINDGGKPETLEVRILTKNGEERWIEHLCSPVRDDHGTQIGVRATNVDITRRKEYERRIENMANYDPLTGLPNRRLLMEKLEQSVQKARSANSKFAVMFLDLDRFKYINDTFGHTLGDKLLREIAQRLSIEYPQNRDGLFISRFGGDEFVVVKELGDEEQPMQTAACILSLVDKQFEVDGQSFYVSGSIGIAIFPYDGETPEDLIKHADTAMYKAKGEGKNNTQLYSADQALQVSEFFALEKMLKIALERDEFVLHYQPQTDLRSGKIIAVEALVRWNSKERGLVSPMEFIPVAEETRLIIQIGEQVLRKACQQWRTWHEQGIVLRMAVNVSPVQFSEPSFCTLVESILREAGMPPQSLEIEITEGVLMGNTTVAMKKLQTIKEMGVTVAVDDFGTGYSSLEYLKDLPIDRLKIDASFVRLIGQDKKALAIVRTIEALAVNLDVETIAEGIETPEQYSALQDIGSSLGQGYLICRPQAAADLDSMLRRGSALNR